MGDAIEFAVIGGSGFYEMPGLEDVEVADIDTPYGRPSDAIRIGTLEGRRVAFLARHGQGHRLLPSELPQRANFWALKSLGVDRVVAVSAVGSLREDYEPGHFAVPDQVVDRTLGQRPRTYFGDGVVAHIAMAEPFCPEMRSAALGALRAAGATAHDGGGYVCIEGPAFGSKAESEIFRSWGLSVVGMTGIPEAHIAREAEICYALLTAVTDYDAWHASVDAVDAAMVFETMAKNTQTSQAAILQLAAGFEPGDECTCRSSLDSALVTDPDQISPERLKQLGPILERRLGVTA